MTIYRRPADLFVAGFFGMPAMNFFTGELVESGDTVSFREEIKDAAGKQPLLIELPQAKAAGLRNAMGKAVVMGFRSEDISLATSSEPGSFETAVEKVELLGAERHIHCRTAANTFVVRQMGVCPASVQEGGRVKIIFNLQAAHFFDASTDASLL